jgi:hypothetical protein
MVTRFMKIRQMIAPALALAAVAVVAAGSLVDARPYSDTTVPLSETVRTPVQDRYVDAPDGVDPVVTGPTSQAFRERQKEAGCDGAVWPNIPAACYPPTALR